jgi:SP family general alpha glucoside:H+ symporter-like MFS transporter
MDVKHDNTITREPKLEAGVTTKEDVDIDVDIKDAANVATDVEHQMSVMEAFRTYPMAVVWSMLFCVCIVMDGYDSDLITNLYGLPAFQRQYGYLFQGKYVVSAPWQTALAMSSPVGRVIGGLIQGPLAELFGRKKTLLMCLFLVTAFIFISFFATSDPVLLVGQMLSGMFSPAKDGSYLLVSTRS